MKNRVGLGTFPLAGVFNSISPKAAEDLVRVFLNEGGHYIDTAPLYGFGEVEKLLGDVLPTFDREQFYLISKCGYVDVEGKDFSTTTKGHTFNDVVRECENSLRRMRLDYIDCYMVHSPSKVTPIEETMAALVKLKEQGKIRDIAVSNVDLSELKQFNVTGEICYVQNRFSYINRSLSREFESYLSDHAIGLIPYHLLEIGMLTDRVLGNFSMRQDDLRRQLPYWNDLNQTEIVKFMRDDISPIARKLMISLEQLMVAWALHQLFIPFVIAGTTKPDYLKTNMYADTISLSDDILQQLETLYLKFEYHIDETYHQSIREFRGLNQKFY